MRGSFSEGAVNDFALETPVVMIIFNRPETTQKVFEQISRVRPRSLYVIADGPRVGFPGDTAKCAEAQAIAQELRWDCQMRVDISEVNLGLKQRFVSGLNWVFSQEEQAIILEDDCVPNPTFFRFCQELLDRYRDDERLMMIAGTNYQFGNNPVAHSYYFSIYTHIWGWATWARAWNCFDGDMCLWPNVRDGGLLKALLPDRRALRFWSKRFQMTYEGKIDTWDYPWTLSCWLENGLTAVPAVNLVTNQGFGRLGTHTLGSRSRLANMPAGKMSFPLQHPPYVVPNWRADAYTQHTVFKEHLLAPLKKAVKQRLQAMGIDFKLRQ